jgi:glyoxylase-like metal-dependent hydrolase (beta-lactamase superfamily II)
VRAVAVDRDAIVVTSRMWQTNAVVVRASLPDPAPGTTPLRVIQAGGGEAEEGGASARESLLIDSPYFPDELEALPALLAQADFTPAGLLATHADFDHLLGRLAFPDLALGLAESTAERIRVDPGVAQRELRDADDGHYVVRPRPLSLGASQALPVPGFVGLGSDEELELHPTDGHTSDGLAVFRRAAGLLVAGDYLSGVEIPVIGAGGSLQGYRATLARLSPLVEVARTIVPGHGSRLDRETALRILDEDLEYLDALEAGEERPRLPEGRATRRQRQIHDENVRAVTATS